MKNIIKNIVNAKKEKNTQSGLQRNHKNYPEQPPLEPEEF